MSDPLVGDDLRGSTPRRPAPDQESRRPRASREARDRRVEDEVAVALGEQAALIIHNIDKWFDYTLSHIERISDRLASPAPAPAKAISSSGPTMPATPSPPRADAPLAGAPVAEFHTRDWHLWRYHQAAKLHPGGIVEIRQNVSTPGVATLPVAVDGGGLFRCLVETELTHSAEGGRLHARVVCDGGEQLGPDVTLAHGTSELFVFAPARTRELALFLIVWQPKVGFTFKLETARIERVELDSYYEARVRGRSRSAIASLASIPARREMLPDCVGSLLLQCDKVRVFLNDYPEVPPALVHPRVEIRRSQDWDDKGDAGKFAWVDDDGEPGYRVIADDDLIFPVDFVEKMTGVVAGYGNRVIAGVHGVLLKQPIVEYYSPESRTAFFFEAPLTRERTVHVLGTNALCYHNSIVHLRWSDFMFRNMADIFLTRYAQKNSLPMVAVERPHHWVRQNKQKERFDTIYEHSAKQTGSRFDSSLIQDAMVKWMAPLTLQPGARPKVALAIIARNIEDFQRTFESWYRTRWLDFDWVTMATPGVDDDGLRTCLEEWRTDHETHVIDGTGTTPCERIDRLLTLARRIGFQAAVVVDGGVEFVGGGWTKPILGVLENPAPRAVLAGGNVGSPTAAWCGIGPENAAPTLVMMNRALAERVAGLDPAQGDSAGAVLEWMRRVGMASSLPSLDPTVASAATKNLRIISGVRNTASTRRQRAAPRAAPPVAAAHPSAADLAVSINEVFRKVLTINLDRRSDRWLAVERRLSEQGIRTERFRAVDGSVSDTLAEYEAYKRRPLVTLPHAARRVETSQEFYQDYDSQTARVAHIEHSTNAKAIQSAGAWGYLKTWEAILERALRERWETLLVFDDDIILHRRTHEIFAAAIGGLPADWLILQLGALQYHWESDWISWRSPFLYSTNGAAIGSHAVGLRFEIVPFLLEQVKRMALPFDTGALSAATHAFKERCFVCYPNIAIQTLGDSDIGTSDFQEARARTDAAETYRWNLADYVVEAGFRVVGRRGGALAPVARIVLNG